MEHSLLNLGSLEQLRRDISAAAFPRLLDAFSSEVRERVGLIVEAGCTAKFATLEREAHAMKSVAGSYGATALYEACHEIEMMCAGDRDEGVASSVRALEALARATLEAFEKWRRTIAT